jgi:glutamine---fructose-6-phosphate transaminase (isomerizing)
MTASAAPSVSSVYAASPQLGDALYLAISQSGRSPDLVQHARMARGAGAQVLALVNVVDSPLAAVAHRVIPLHAGPERSVAATKSYIGALSAILHLAARWRAEDGLLKAVAALPAGLKDAWSQDWSAALEVLARARNLFVIGRGLGLGIAQEAALKFKETCGLHAEAFSAAEVRHGPMTLVGPDFPVLCFVQQDDTLQGLDELVAEFRARGARVFVASPVDATVDVLPVSRASHPACTPVLAIQSFYRMVNALALRRGRNPDVPPHLNKVTETL